MPVTLPNINLAIKRAFRESDILIHKMAAICFLRNGSVLGVSANRRGDGYVSDYSYHAEEMVLNKTEYARRKARKENAKVYLLVVRINRRGELRLAAPCRSCFVLCKEAGISQIFYTNVTGNIDTWAV